MDIVNSNKKIYLVLLSILLSSSNFLSVNGFTSLRSASSRHVINRRDDLFQLDFQRPTTNTATTSSFSDSGSFICNEVKKESLVSSSLASYKVSKVIHANEIIEQTNSKAGVSLLSNLQQKAMEFVLYSYEVDKKQFSI